MEEDMSPLNLNQLQIGLYRVVYIVQFFFFLISEIMF